MVQLGMTQKTLHHLDVVAYICQRIVGQTALPTPPSAPLLAGLRRL